MDTKQCESVKEYRLCAKVAGKLLVVANHKFRLFLSQVLPARLNRPLDEKGGLLLARHVSIVR